MASVFQSTSHAPDTLAGRGLGLASIGVGLTELAAPRQLEKLMGLGNGRVTGILRILGVREIMHGVDLLAHDDPTQGVFSRVAGDVLDGVLLGLAARKTRRPDGFMAVCGAVLPLVVLDILFALRLERKKRQSWW